MKANRKALGKRDLEIMIFNKVLHPTNKQIKQANRDKLARIRTEHLGKYISPNKKTARKKASQIKTHEQILKGYDLTKKWKDEYDEKTKSLL